MVTLSWLNLHVVEVLYGGKQMGKYTQLAKDIIENVGGKENVVGVVHCVTRLRFTLKDESLANDEVLKNMDGVVTIMKAIGQYMVVIGEHVPEVYDEVCRQLGMENTNVAKPQPEEKKKSLLDRTLGVIMGGMGPTLNLMCACGIIKGLVVLLGFAGISPDSGLYMLLNAAGDCFFYFLPLILGHNLAKKFNIDPFFGTILAAAMCYPALQNTDIHLFGMTINTSYVSTFLPILFGLLLAAPLYKWLDKRLPAMIKGFMTPLLTLVIIFPLTFVVIGPAANLIGKGLNSALTFIFGLSPILAGLLLGGLWQVFVLFGIHGVLTVVAFMDLLQGNPSQILAFSYGASFATCGVVLSILLKTKYQKLKELALPSFISAIFGVTEPATYGITLPRKKMFALCCVGGATSGLVVALCNLSMHTYAGMGVIGLLGFVDAANPNLLGIALMAIVPFVVSLGLGLIVYKDSDYADANAAIGIDSTASTAESKKEKTHTDTIELAMPVDGKVDFLKNSKDEAFSSEVLGKGCLLYPEDGHLYAPCDGVVRTLFPTHHAIVIAGDNGCEVLLHVGINTVSLEGRHFEAHVEQGAKVKRGQLLLTFDQEKIEEEGYACEIPMLVTNMNDYLDVLELDHEFHTHGDTIVRIVPKKA